MADEVTDPSVDQTDGAPDASEAIEYARPSTPHAHMTAGITRGDIAVLAVRLLGIYLIIGALPALGYLIESFFTPMRLGTQVQFYLMYVAILFAVGSFMVIKATLIGRWLLPKETMNPHPPVGAGTLGELQAVAFSVVGVALVVFASPDLAQIVAEYASGNKRVDRLIKPGIEFIAGLLLFFRGKRLARYWQSLPASSPVLTDDDSGPL